MNSGARSPTLRVELTLAIEARVKQGRKPDNHGRNKGTKKGSGPEEERRQQEARMESREDGMRSSESIAIGRGGPTGRVRDQAWLRRWSMLSAMSARISSSSPSRM